MRCQSNLAETVIVVDFGFWEEFNMSRYVFFEFFDDIILLFGI